MSHNVTLEGVEFRDLSVLERAVKELAAETGVECKFVNGRGEKVDVRGWRGSAGEGTTYGNSAWDAEHNHKCDAAIQFPGEKYDIGFNYDKAKGAYVPFIESSWRTPFAPEQGALTVAGNACAAPTTHALAGQTGSGALVGRLQQHYSVCMAEKNAAMQGLPTRRVVGKGGQIQLHVNHR